MYDALRVQMLDSRKKLVRDHESGFQRETTSAELEQVLKTGSEQIEHHHFIVIMPAEPVYRRESDRILKEVVSVCLLF